MPRSSQRLTTGAWESQTGVTEAAWRRLWASWRLPKEALGPGWETQRDRFGSNVDFMFFIFIFIFMFIFIFQNDYYYWGSPIGSSIDRSIGSSTGSSIDSSIGSSIGGNIGSSIGSSR